MDTDIRITYNMISAVSIKQRLIVRLPESSINGVADEGDGWDLLSIGIQALQRAVR